MPAFQAINLEPEENIDEQIDTTKELHVDEALKRFQNALKLQAQGVRSRSAAGVAYKELFESEIFQYREARTEYERAEQQTSGRSGALAPELFLEGLDIGAGGADGVAANLSLALYLSYKNYGHFFLDKLKDASDSDPRWRKRRRVCYEKDEGHKVLDNWTAALDQDPSDPELWRKAARFAASMDSGRIKRYCLEAAIEMDDDPSAVEVEPPSLAESLAGEQLKVFLQHLGDSLALSHPIMFPWLKKQMPALIKRHLDPIPFLPDPTSDPRSLRLSNTRTNGNADGATTPISETEPCELTITSWSDFALEMIKDVEDVSGIARACRCVLKAELQDIEMEGAEKVKDSKQAPSSSVNKGTCQELNKDDAAASLARPEARERQASDIAEDVKASDPHHRERTLSISTRKRSQSVAGLPEGLEEEHLAEKRSKRVRRRVETAHAEEPADPSKVMADQLRDCQEVDQHLFQMTKNILETLEVEDKDTFRYLDGVLDLCVAEDRTSKLTRLTARDLWTLIANFSEDTAMVFLNKKEHATLGLSSFLEHAKTGSQDQPAAAPFNEVRGLREFAQRIDERRDRMTGSEVAFEWILAISPSYSEYKWSETMKTSVVRTLNAVDSFLYRLICSELEDPSISPKRLAAYESIIPMLFELHIEIYERITNPSSAVDYATRMDTKYRLDRWLDVASLYVRLLNRPATDAICVRFMWASVMASSLLESPVREHILLLWTSLREFLALEDVQPIHLPNNMVMPTISPAAADREISKLTTMDFFLSLFQEEMENPIHVIETLEPVLNPSTVYVADEGARRGSLGSSDVETSDSEKQQKLTAISECANQGMRDLWKFLRSSSTELRLFLWSRLGDAYEAIKYPTKRFSCHLRSIEIIVADLEGDKYASLPDESRRVLFLRTLKSLDELLIQALSLALNDSSAFDIIDNDHLQSSASALVKVSCLLHVAFLCEDEVRIGVTAAPSSNPTFQSLITKLREVQVRAWCLQYAMFKASLPFQKSIAPEKDLADFLAAVHQVIGLRKCCKVSNKIFLKVMRMELLKSKNIENWEDYLGQVVYDLHGLKLGIGPEEVQDHGCPAEKLEKRQTMQLVEKVMVLASRMPMKDLLKSDLKMTIEHMQQTMGQPKSTSQMIHNLRNFTELLKKPIHPLRLYQALSGGVSVDAVATHTPEAVLAKHGWFFLLGMIALTKFKGVDLNRRQTPGATDDLRIGATFLRLQLQFTADRWEAWFRLAECFDYELDEAVLWSADKMNKDRPELVKFQRNAIHCYTLALSHSRHQDVNANDGDSLHDLYHKFGMRLYASSREPFAMEPFQHSEHERFFIESAGSGTFKRILHQEMSGYKVWKLAAKLFRMAMEREPGNWKNPYMLAKCYWKMYQTPVDKLEETDRKCRIRSSTVLDTLQKAINVAYNARRSRHSDPILEPHYKMVSILHKLVVRGQMPAKEAAVLLSKQPLGVRLNPDDIFASFAEPEDWEEYIIPNLLRLKEKDKSNWQHRIVARHAKILFDEASELPEGDGKVEAKAAFGILRENMFTKTMVMNVWKCDAERPGRHHVYTEQYVRFMTTLLAIMSDRVNMELLLRRLRKKGADFYHFTDLWQSSCQTYLKLLRREHRIPHLGDETFRLMSAEEFESVSERITEWAAAGDDVDVGAFVCMKEAIELKKLNANLMKAAAIDDLISDCYSKLYVEVGAAPAGLEPSKMMEERGNGKEVATQSEATAQADGGATVSLGNILKPPSNAQQEGLAGTSTPLDGDKSETAPKGRRSGVRRADVLRKAEQAMIRSMEMPKSAVVGSRVGSLSSGKRGSQTPNAGASDAETEDEGPDAQVRREAGEEEDLDAEMADEHVNDAAGDEGGDDGEGLDDSKMDGVDEVESDGGSIHDDADDESDLSDVPEGYEDDIPPGLLFSSILGRAGQSAEASGEDADSESEGDEPAEGEGKGRETTIHRGYGRGEIAGPRADTHDSDETEVASDDTEMVDIDATTFSVDETIEMGR